MKRKTLTETSVCNHTRSKKPRIIVPEHLEYVSATDIHNYMVDDTLVDWLKLQKYKSFSQYSCRVLERDNFTDFIMQKGHDFEEKVVFYIDKNICKVTHISPYITQASLNKTIQLMKAGSPIIHSVPVLNDTNGTKGVIDLLVRSDYINKLCSQKVIDDDMINKKAPYLTGNYHYIVVDVKFSTLPLRSDGIHLQNIDDYSAYKAQLLIYTQAIAQIQGFNPKYAFILGRRWKYTKKSVVYSNNNCLERLGKIDYDNVDISYIESTIKAIKWVKTVRKNAYKWSVTPPSCIELYPNMCRDSGNWNKEKKEIADNIGEMTSIWCVGQKHRNNAIQKGITSWRDSRCNTSIMDFTGKKASTVDKILDINRQSNDKIRPAKITNNLFNWKDASNNLYIDFETLADCSSDFSELPLQENKQLIFMIGVGWTENDDWKYINFTCRKNSLEEEFRIMNEFSHFVISRNNPKLVFWCAEQQFWERSLKVQLNNKNYVDRLQILNKWKFNNWCDLCMVFRNEPVVLKGSHNFGLKNVANAMYTHGMITVQLESECKNGMTAMVQALKLYNSGIDVDTSTVMMDIKKYNEFDCKVLQQILNFFIKHSLQ